MPCCTWKCVPAAVSGGVDIFEVLGCRLLQQMSFYWGSKKLLQSVFNELTVCFFVFNFFLTQCIIAILSKRCKLDNFKPLSSLKSSFMNIQGLHSNYIECNSFLESSTPNIFILCETNSDDSIDSGNISVRGYLPLIEKDYITHMHGLVVNINEGLPFARDLSLVNSDSYLHFQLALLHSDSYFFPLYRSSSLSLCTVFHAIVSSIDEVQLLVLLL